VSANVSMLPICHYEIMGEIEPRGCVDGDVVSRQKFRWRQG
jgi:hypothetical protein